MRLHVPGSRRTGFIAVSILAGLGGAAVFAAAASAQEGHGGEGSPPPTVQASSSDALDKRHAQWLAEVAAIMTSEERELFFRLTREPPARRLRTEVLAGPRPGSEDRPQ